MEVCRKKLRATGWLKTEEIKHQRGWTSGGRCYVRECLAKVPDDASSAARKTKTHTRTGQRARKERQRYVKTFVVTSDFNTASRVVRASQGDGKERYRNSGTCVNLSFQYDLSIRIENGDNGQGDTATLKSSCELEILTRLPRESGQLRETVNRTRETLNRPVIFRFHHVPSVKRFQPLHIAACDWGLPLYEEREMEK